jgi:hypothetical protein
MAVDLGGDDWRRAAYLQEETQMIRVVAFVADQLFTLAPSKQAKTLRL